MALYKQKVTLLSKMCSCVEHNLYSHQMQFNVLTTFVETWKVMRSSMVKAALEDEKAEE